ncbi:MAG: sulfite exporter TauE/SafE family protein [Bryobacteraceae bacterium]
MQNLDVATYVGLLGLGLVAGVLAGMFGIGGGLVIVPALLYVFKFNDMQAIGTSLAALVPPVGLLGAVEYYKRGYIQFGAAACIAIGLLIGAVYGARITMASQSTLIHRLYGGFLAVAAIRMIVWGK